MFFVLNIRQHVNVIVVVIVNVIMIGRSTTKRYKYVGMIPLLQRRPLRWSILTLPSPRILSTRTRYRIAFS